jgi:hypothetical protein
VSISTDRDRSAAWDPCWTRSCGDAGASTVMGFPRGNTAERCRGCWVPLDRYLSLSLSFSLSTTSSLAASSCFWRSNCCPSLAAIRSSLPPSLSHPLSMPLPLSSWSALDPGLTFDQQEQAPAGQKSGHLSATSRWPLLKVELHFAGDGPRSKGQGKKIKPSDAESKDWLPAAAGGEGAPSKLLIFSRIDS